ncbi:MAG: DUF456 domain-containing protein [Alistipes sp.]|nr:DUF456 domain-containing protein [Alistipes sp.]MBR2169274.1 DUF456 domain-containing protein [Alistipes sp.]
MEILIAICAILCGIIGVLGAVLPVLPGPALSFIGMVLAYFNGGDTITERMLWIWGVITIVISILDYILPGYFSKVFGGTKAGITGATIGVFAGLFLGPLGIIIGPFAGAVIGELLHEKQNLEKAIAVGFGSLISFLVGSGLKLIVTGFMLYYIIADVF